MYDQSRGLFELRGVHITEMFVQCNATEHSFNPPTHTSDQSEVIPKATDNDQQSNNSHVTNLDVNNMNGTLLTRCCALSFYCICFSINKACNYWNSDTLDSISDHGNTFYTRSLNKECLTINDLPASLKIYDADISVAYNLQKQSKLCCTSETSELELQNNNK